MQHGIVVVVGAGWRWRSIRSVSPVLVFKYAPHAVHYLRLGCWVERYHVRIFDIQKNNHVFVDNRIFPRILADRKGHSNITILTPYPSAILGFVLWIPADPNARRVPSSEWNASLGVFHEENVAGLPTKNLLRAMSQTFQQERIAADKLSRVIPGSFNGICSLFPSSRLVWLRQHLVIIVRFHQVKHLPCTYPNLSILEVMDFAQLQKVDLWGRPRPKPAFGMTGELSFLPRRTGKKW